jgi:RNA polymerase sigma factor (sigma-70 family)
MQNVLNAMSLSDRDLIAACLSGEQRAWTELISRYQRLIYSVAWRLCPQPEDSADVFQRVCMELYQRLGRIRNDETLPAWLITVTKRSAYAVLKTRLRTVSFDEYEPAAAEEIGQMEKEFALERAVAELPDRCRSLIDALYFDVDEPSYQEISGRLGMPVSSIGPTRARCLEKLRKILGS